MSKVLIKDFYRTWIIFWSYYVMSLSSSLSSSVCRHNGLYSITFILIYRSFWNFNTKIHITVKKLRLIWGIVVCFQTRSSKGPKRGGFVFGLFIVHLSLMRFLQMNYWRKSLKKNICIVLFCCYYIFHLNIFIDILVVYEWYTTCKWLSTVFHSSYLHPSYILIIE
jgi:hypothetical protein